MKDLTGNNIVAILLLLAFTCFMVNIYGIEFAIEKKLANRKKKKKESKIGKREEVDDKNLDKRSNQRMIFAIIITVALEILLMYILGVAYENGRCSYKLVLVEQEVTEDSKYIFRYQNGKKNYIICPIVFENNDCYILTRLYKEDGKIKIEYEYQKIIEKTDVETFDFDNVYKINIGE
jgi:hypothetical protein